MERWAASLGIPEVPVKAIIRRHSTPIPLIGTTCKEPGNVGEDVAKRSRRSALAGHSPPRRCGEQAAAPSEINRVAQDPAVLLLGGNREVKHKVVMFGGRVGRETRDTQVLVGEKQSRQDAGDVGGASDEPKVRSP